MTVCIRLNHGQTPDPVLSHWAKPLIQSKATGLPLIQYKATGLPLIQC